MTQPWMMRGSFVVALLVTTAAAARDEAAVGQCGLTFVNTGNSCEQVYGGAGADPPNGEKLETCWDKATSDYNQCMDKALAAPPASAGAIDLTKRNLLNPATRGGAGSIMMQP